MIRIKTSWTCSIPTNVVLNIAKIGSVGRICKAPGTLGSIVGLIWYTLFLHQASPVRFTALLLGSIYLAIAFCGEAETRLGKIDPPEVVLDEVVAVPLCFLGADYLFAHFPVWLVLLVGFIFFRIFDIIKPFGIKKLQRFYGGMGVVIDDLAAGLWTCASIHVLFGLWFLIQWL